MTPRQRYARRRLDHVALLALYEEAAADLYELNPELSQRERMVMARQCRDRASRHWQLLERLHAEYRVRWPSLWDRLLSRLHTAAGRREARAEQPIARRTP